MSEPKTIYDKIWDTHLVHEDNNDCLLYIDRHLIHEVTSPQAFEGLRMSNRKVRKPSNALAVADHNIPTTDRSKGISDQESEIQIQTLEDNCNDFGIEYIKTNDKRQGIVHIIGPEQGFTLPGLTIVCGDSHTSTHGAFGALAHGIGTSEVEHVLATQTLIQKKAKNFKVTINGKCNESVTAKDLALSVIGAIGTAGGTGYVIEYTGDAVKSLSIEGRMTLCNLTIEAGARVGLVAVDEKTISYCKNRLFGPNEYQIDNAIRYWRTLHSDKEALFDKEVELTADSISPQVTWGTSPEMVCSVTESIPDTLTYESLDRQKSYSAALEYMNLKPGIPMTEIRIDKVFIGSCTNSRIEDLREAAEVLKGQKVSENIQEAIVVPGSGMVKEQAEKEGIHKIFIDAGFQWRAPGCSMCLGMNPDQLSPYERCASTSNRNFEGRQGNLGRTHLMSPKMAALTAINGRIVKEI